jgi:hypothetical protein
MVPQPVMTPVPLNGGAHTAFGVTALSASDHICAPFSPIGARKAARRVTGSASCRSGAWTRSPAMAALAVPAPGPDQPGALAIPGNPCPPGDLPDSPLMDIMALITPGLLSQMVDQPPLDSRPRRGLAVQGSPPEAIRRSWSPPGRAPANLTLDHHLGLTHRSASGAERGL